ncbi:IgGFc-binding protein-like isoform X2 [Tubulanus polymorphus]|uniref:IgGFc-binding protein-like isoform X2 n=1 Tax=Tubulanus polymorphus TaxID=672921 RepID=UPI003DA24799
MWRSAIFILASFVLFLQSITSTAEDKDDGFFCQPKTTCSVFDSILSNRIKLPKGNSVGKCIEYCQDNTPCVAVNFHAMSGWCYAFKEEICPESLLHESPHSTYCISSSLDRATGGGSKDDFVCKRDTYCPFYNTYGTLRAEVPVDASGTAVNNCLKYCETHPPCVGVNHVSGWCYTFKDKLCPLDALQHHVSTTYCYAAERNPDGDDNDDDDYDVCAMKPCAGDADCEPLPDGQSRECICEDDDKVYEENVGCVQKNSCTPKPCKSGAKCNPLPDGNYQCTCATGMVYDPNKGCIEWHPCMDNPCGGDAICEPTTGKQFKCSCTRDNQIYDKVKGCIDWNDCMNFPCLEGSTCLPNEGGGYKCLCSSFHVYDPKRGCLNQCQLKPCVGKDVICSENNGERKCQCTSTSHKYDEKLGCILPDPCDANPCKGKEATCQRNPGKSSFRCVCPKGKEYDEELGCITTQCSSTCTMHGDPHYTSFDGLKFDFQGPCKYILVDYPGNSDGSCKFRIVGKNQRLPRNPKVSETKYIEVTVDGLIIRLAANSNVWINGELRAHPVTGLPDHLSIRTQTRNAVFVTSSKCGFTVSFKTRNIVNIKMHSPNAYNGKLGGLCGNCNKNRTDDWTVCSQGDHIGDIYNARARKQKYKVGSNCMVPDPDAVLKECTTPIPPFECVKDIYKGKDKCGFINDVHGPFKDCIKHKDIDSLTMFDNCVFDACASIGDVQYICEALQTLENTCLSKKLPVKPWRSASLCPMKCPPNSHFEGSMSACQPTCTQSQINSCPIGNVAGCKCDDGYVLAGTECIKKTDCDLCTPNPCKNQGDCQTVGGKVKCVCRDGFYGDLCDRDNDICAMKPCAGDADCEPSPDGQTRECICGGDNEIYEENIGCVQKNGCTPKPCKSGAKCNPLPDGKYQCTCATGMVYDPNKGCIEWHPCMDNPCGGDAICEPTTGKQFKCSCTRDNQIYDKVKGCIDWNDCMNFPCLEGSTCLPKESGGYKCLCSSFHVYDPKRGCLNQCQLKPCVGKDVVCSENNGERKCQCTSTSHKYDEKLGCILPDPCDAKPCKGQEATCQRNPGKSSFRCVCPKDKEYDEELGCISTQCSSTCTMHGDPHYTSFDGLKFDFQGPCKYILVDYPGNSDGSCKFRIVGKNQRLAKHPMVSETKYIEVTVDGLNIRLAANSKVWINGELRAHPITGLPDHLSIRTQTRNAVFVTSSKCGFTVSFKTRNIVNIKMHSPNAYNGKLGGLCGNCNKNRTDDWTVCSQGDHIGDIYNARARKQKYKVGSNCMVPDPDAVLKECTTPIPPFECVKDIYKGKDKCGFINDVHGPFKDCIKHKDIDSLTMFDNCVFDACASIGDVQYICEALQTLENTCLSKKLPVKPWRSASLCPMKCPPNSHFEGSMSACQPTCTQSQINSCPIGNVAGCKCDDGYVLAGTECIKKTDCDLCTPNPCKNQGDCQTVGGKVKCVCRDGFYGDLCDRDNDICAMKPCAGDADCEPSPDGQTRECICGGDNEIYEENIGCVQKNGCTPKPCKSGAKCNPLPDGKYQCTCATGMVYDPNKGCIEWHPCMDNPCGGDAICEPTTGKQFKCSCTRDNQIYDKVKGCIDWNDCMNFPCLEGSTCLPKESGGYKCLCSSFHVYDPKRGCLMPDPCDAKPCKGQEATCQRNPGKSSFRCVCPKDKEYDEELGCISTQCSSTCTMHGDPHYTSFDGLKFDFQGPCKYILVDYPGNSDGSCKFRIVGKNQRLAKHPMVSETKYIEVTVDGLNIRLAANSKVWINGELRAHPITGLPDHLSIRTQTRNAVFVTSSKCGFTVSFKTRNIVNIKMHSPNAYNGKLGGLCGNCNQNRTDDWTVCSQGDHIGDIYNARARKQKYKVGSNCMVPDPDAVLKECTTPIPPFECVKDIYKGKDKCGFINDVHGPFKDCIKHKDIDSLTMFDNCVFDACASSGDVQYICEALQTLENTCLSKKLPVKAWRSASLCPMKCPPNSHFEGSMSACQPTCTQSQINSCPIGNVAGCKCDDGYVLAGTECIKKTDCDLCTPNPCKNQGNCQTVGAKVKCICRDGFHGDFCDDAQGVCRPNPCKGTATCVISKTDPSAYECTCDKTKYDGYHPDVGCYKYGDKTENGNSKGAPCTFPFIYKGTPRTRCIPMDAKRPWCAVTPNYDKDFKWGYCSSHLKVYGGNDPLATCAFPFIYQGKSYDHCIAGITGRTWCGTVTDFDTNLYWGYCEP